MIEVALFLGEVSAAEGNRFGYRVGERHAVIVFLRQHKGTSPDFDAAKKEMENRGWENVVLHRAANSITNIEAINSMHPNMSASYEDALNYGFSAFVYSDPIE